MTQNRINFEYDVENEVCNHKSFSFSMNCTDKFIEFPGVKILWKCADFLLETPPPGN